MASTWSVCKGLAAVVITSAAAFALCPNAAADPATPQPNPTQQLPGLPALAQLSPIIQQAAMNPAQATQLLMAAASAFAGNPAVPTESKNVASSVNQFVAEPTNPDSAALGVPAPHGVALPEAIPVPHVPPLGAEPGVQAHLPTGIDPSHAAGPAPAVAPTVTPPVAAPPASAPAPAPDAAQPVAVPGPPPAPPAPRAGAGRPPVTRARTPQRRPPWGRYARGGPTDGYVGAAAAVGGAVDELCASERGRRPLAAAGHAVGARLSRGARFDAPTRRHRLGGPGRGPRPLPVDRRRGDDRSRGGPAA